MEKFDQIRFACGVGITLLGLGLHSVRQLTLVAVRELFTVTCIPIAVGGLWGGVGSHHLTRRGSC